MNVRILYILMLFASIGRPILLVADYTSQCSTLSQALGMQNQAGVQHALEQMGSLVVNCQPFFDTQYNVYQNESDTIVIISNQTLDTQDVRRITTDIESGQTPNAWLIVPGQPTVVVFPK